MLNVYPGAKLRNLRKRALLTQMDVVDLTGISETTIHYLEHDLRRPQSHTLDKLLSLYSIRITRLEKMDQMWGEDGKQNRQAADGRPVQQVEGLAGNGHKPSLNNPEPSQHPAGRRLPRHARNDPQGN
jgi:transcriptional regulator with XRE-family HTH domain